MKRIINFNQAILASLFLIGLLILFHLSILIGVILFDYAPIDFLWGGQMKTVEQLINFEMASLLVSFLFFFLVLVKSNRLNQPKLKKGSGSADLTEAEDLRLRTPSLGYIKVYLILSKCVPEPIIFIPAGTGTPNNA